MIKMVCITFGVFSIENVHFEHLLNVKMCLHIYAHRTFVSAQKTVNKRSMNAQCLLGRNRAPAGGRFGPPAGALFHPVANSLFDSRFSFAPGIVSRLCNYLLEILLVPVNTWEVHISHQYVVVIGGIDVIVVLKSIYV